MYVAGERDKWQAFVKTVMNLWFQNIAGNSFFNINNLITIHL